MAVVTADVIDAMKLVPVPFLRLLHESRVISHILYFSRAVVSSTFLTSSITYFISEVTT